MLTAQVSESIAWDMDCRLQAMEEGTIREFNQRKLFKYYTFEWLKWMDSGSKSNERRRGILVKPPQRQTSSEANSLYRINTRVEGGVDPLPAISPSRSERPWTELFTGGPCLSFLSIGTWIAVRLLWPFQVMELKLHHASMNSVLRKYPSPLDQERTV